MAWRSDGLKVLWRRTERRTDDPYWDFFINTPPADRANSMLDVIRQDYIRALRAHGVPERRVIYRHALRNALNPVVTVVWLEFGFLMAGAVIVETVFSLPGIGRLMVTAIFSRDYPVIQGGMLMIAVSFVAANLLIDLAYAWINPRIRYERA